jgi:hypothetical protein
MPELSQRLGLDLADALARDKELTADLSVAHYSITSSARASMIGGISRPIALARIGRKSVESFSLLPSRDGSCLHCSFSNPTKSRRKF